MADVHVHLYKNNPQAALATLQKKTPNPNDLLLRELDYALLKRQIGQFKQSNKHFEQAKKIAVLLEATSVSDQFQAMTVNDETIEYQGHNYELLFIHGFSALNYLDLGKIDEARVEVLQAQEKIKKWQQPEKGSGGYLWVEYLAGAIYEKLGELDNAVISYRNVVQGLTKLNKPVPSFLQHGFLALLKQQDLTEEYKKNIEKFDIDEVENNKNQGDLIVIFFNGLAPKKRTHHLPTFSHDAGKNINIALPYYPVQKPLIHHANIIVAENTKITAQFDSVDSLARLALQDDMPAIITRGLLRKAVKRKLVSNADKEKDNLISLFARVASMATEHADTRGWNTLPSNVQIARFKLAPGEYKILAEFIDYNGHMRAAKKLTNIAIEKNQIKVFSFHRVIY